MFPIPRNKFLRRHLDAQIDDPVAVVRQDNFHQVFANVVNIPFHRRQQDAAPGGRIAALHMRLQVGHGELHRFGALQDFGDNQLVGVELAAHFVHPGHQRPVDDGQGRAVLQRQVQVGGQPFLAALDDALRQPFVQRQGGALRGGSARRAVAEMGGESRHRVIPPVPNQILRQPPFLFRYGRVALHHLRVHNRQIQPGLSAVIQKDGVEHLPAGRRQPERHIGNAQRRLGVGQRVFNQTHPRNGFGGGTDIIFIASAGGEHQRVKNNVLLRHAVLFGKQLMGTPGNLQLALFSNRLGLVRVVINAAHHQRGPIAPGQGNNPPEPFLAVLQVDGVDDGLALQPFQRLLNHGGVSGVNHYGGFNAAVELVQKPDHIRRFIPVRVLQAYIQDLGAVANLPASNFGGFLKPPAANKPLEPPAA